MKGRITAALGQWLAEGRNCIGEILVREKNGCFTLVHYADETAAGLEVFTKPEDARGLSLHDAAGEYRPLKTAPNLRHGWELRLRDLSELHAALDFFYPAALGVLLAHGEGSLKPVDFRETASRQSGMYDVVKKISDEQADILIGDFCKSDGNCIKTILWKIAPSCPLTKLPMDKFDPRAEQLRTTPGQSIPLLCCEACNLLVAAAREVVKKGRAS
ncbi:MAG TPA: DR2241 family protein [Chthoniobacteraceae bacterium]|nr:DR2241 family protein [Chthoniobacteraceae bacterium]